ncbi:hypothetical protein CA601_23050 [Paraburkholderia hospita]|nr:hypothetical protein CA602_31055 [Paraburkholderia hospita]OUL85888.1 hypothetical protein CA601_23050 [Paraburkholderia hospita]
MVKAAELIGLEIASKREVFDDLRKLGFTDAKMDSERRIAAPLRLVVHIVIPVAKEVLSDYEKTEK